jgi:hypothetical protein
VRFIDRDDRDVERLDALAEGLVRQPLGRDVEQLDCSRVELFIKLAQLVSRERGVQPRGGDALRCQRVHLIPHQRDERGNHQCEPIEQQCRELVTKRLAATRRENRQRGPAVQQAADHRFLASAEGGESKRAGESFQHR